MPLSPSAAGLAAARTAAAIAAVAVAPLLAFNVPPSSTFLNQAASFFGFGIWMLLLVLTPAADGATPDASRTVPWVLLGALAIAALAALAAPLTARLPASLSLSPAAAIAAAALVATIAAGAGRGAHGPPATPAFRDFSLGLVVAGVLSSAVGLVQVFAPSWADGNVIAATYIEGRAVGNMRQPNHLSSLLLWSTLAALWLGEARVLKRGLDVVLASLFLFVVVLTASRTGALSMALLFVWGLLDRRLSKRARALLLVAPLLYFVFWYATGVWADRTHHVFGGETRFSTAGDVSSSRIGIWSNTLELIRMHPWFGVGWGNFNFAWTLTPFPHRPVAFFDHTHNLVLQLLVELGIPLGALACALLLAALVRAFRAARAPVPSGGPPGGATLRATAFVMVVLIVVHSLLEYPLWYAYYLLPAAFAFGTCLAGGGGFGEAAGRRPAPAGSNADTGGGRASIRSRALPTGAAALLAIGALASIVDYTRVVAIFAPASWDTRSLAQRIADGRRSVFFEHHADYAAATNTEHPSQVLPSFATASHYLLDARLLEAWATALDEAGETDRARYLATRLREFHNDQNAEFFAVCEVPADPDEPAPFQCQAPEHVYRYEDFR